MNSSIQQYETGNFQNVNAYFTINDDSCLNVVAESFGVSGGYINHICNLDIPNDYNILLITGESGSGKTTILNKLKPSDYTDAEIPHNIPLFEWGGITETEQFKTMSDLSMVGLSDALMFINTYDQLSDSQKARARIYLEYASGKDVIYIDEFLSTLDRKTAHAVAYTIQKLIRKTNKKLVCTTAHTDLEKYLMPDIVIEGKAFPSRFKIRACEVLKTNPFLDKIKMFYGTKETYKNLELAELHYKGKYTGETKEYLFASLDDDIIGVLVSTYNMANDGRRISRLVVHPSYRGCGVGQLLVKKYISDYDNTDVISAMALFNPVFEKSGMERVADTKVKPPKGLSLILKNNNFDLNKWFDKAYCECWCEEEKHRKMISEFAKYATKLIQPGGKKLSIDEIRENICDNAITCGRVLYQLRPRRMARLTTENYRTKKQNK